MLSLLQQQAVHKKSQVEIIQKNERKHGCLKYAAQLLIYAVERVNGSQQELQLKMQKKKKCHYIKSGHLYNNGIFCHCQDFNKSANFSCGKKIINRH